MVLPRAHGGESQTHKECQKVGGEQGEGSAKGKECSKEQNRDNEPASAAADGYVMASHEIDDGGKHCYDKEKDVDAPGSQGEQEGTDKADEQCYAQRADAQGCGVGFVRVGL